MAIRIAFGWLFAFVVFASTAWSEEANSVFDDVQKGHHLAALICSNCHVAGPDQLSEPILRPPAPSLESIAQHSTTSADTIRSFLTTTHRDISNPKGMPNPELADYQIKQVVAYLLSLRKPSAAEEGKPSAAQEGKPSATQEGEPSAGQVGSCRMEIVRLESVLSQARANRQVVGSAPESSAARLHRQPTPKSVGQAATEAEKTLETALVLARKLESEGMDAECTAMLKKVGLPLSVR